ncbi:MAG: TetR/AcrR family transcriptional regulator [Actinomycetota bacterium]|nr:TetR/AcrR family transcriptional regulator [Actinomycetota bacterium]
MAVGVRRTTMSDVARRAGVSRQTAYRRHPDVASLLSSLMTREFGRVLERASAEVAEIPTGRERVVAQTVLGGRMLGADPLFERILDVDPELLLPYVVERLGEVQRMVIAGLAAEIARGVEDGSIRSERPETLAAAIELLARGFLLGAHAERDDDLDAWGELAIALNAYLRPAA